MYTFTQVSVSSKRAHTWSMSHISLAETLPAAAHLSALHVSESTRLMLQREGVLIISIPVPSQRPLGKSVPFTTSP
eukprot:m51a1_g9160 hypothetical protein (76) ;mRNA; r:138162-138444